MKELKVTKKLHVVRSAGLAGGVVERGLGLSIAARRGPVEDV